MNTIVKVLIGVAVAGATAFVVKKVCDNKSRYTKVGGEDPDEFFEDDDIPEGAEPQKESAQDVAVKAVNFIMDHEKQISSIITFIGLITGVIEIIDGLDKLRHRKKDRAWQKDITDQLEAIKNTLRREEFVYE